jgi:hypothetical protein
VEDEPLVPDELEGWDEELLWAAVTLTVPSKSFTSLPLVMAASFTLKTTSD